jgi:ribosome-associated protein
VGEALRINDQVSIDSDELEWRFTTSGGPGGQHANRSATRAEVRFAVESSASLTAAQRTLLTAKLGPMVVGAADEERSQWRNRALAQQRLVTKLARALYRPPFRRPTKPSRSAVERRLTDKKRRAATKRTRRSGHDD